MRAAPALVFLACSANDLPPAAVATPDAATDLADAGPEVSGDALADVAPPPPPPCIGVRPPDSAWASASDVTPTPDGADAIDAVADAADAVDADAVVVADGGDVSDGGPAPCPTCLGDPAPSWAALDFQPRSCGFGATYGLDVFAGHVTVIALLSAG